MEHHWLVWTLTTVWCAARPSLVVVVGGWGVAGAGRARAPVRGGARQGDRARSHCGVHRLQLPGAVVPLCNIYAKVYGLFCLVLYTNCSDLLTASWIKPCLWGFAQFRGIIIIILAAMRLISVLIQLVIIWSKLHKKFGPNRLPNILRQVKWKAPDRADRTEM